MAIVQLQSSIETLYKLSETLGFRIRKGFRSEAKLVAEILPVVLDDFFPPTDVMNKVIGEFLSSQQPHPELMASVLYKVCIPFTVSLQWIKNSLVLTIGMEDCRKSMI